VNGEFVPLSLQDTSLWSAELRTRADAELRRAASLGHMGRFQLEAAISAAHSSRADGAPTDWDAICVLYRGLLRLAPSIGATIGAAAALVEVGEYEQASALLDGLPAQSVRDHQPYWVCRSRVAAARGDASAARAASDRAIGLTADPAIRTYLLGTRPV
jgi:RNA polymerase sigma-70 factor (ECF subfamily)